MQKPTSYQGYTLRLGTALGLVGALVCLPECSSPQRPPSATCEVQQAIQLVVQSSDRLNLDDRGRSLPTIVRVYQLKAITRLENAEFEDIWRRATPTLGEDLVQADEVTLYPSQRLARAFARKRDALYVVAVAIVRHPAGVSWRTVYELPPAPGEARCAALQRDPASNPPPPPDPRYYFFLEDYRIEGGEEPPSEPDAGAGDAAVPTSAPSSSPPRAPRAPGMTGLDLGVPARFARDPFAGASNLLRLETGV